MNDYKYVERYVYDVTSRLSKNVSEDVSKELTANIYDMLSDNPTKVEVEKVLKELGKPSEIAQKYQNQKKYIISPKYYDAYLKTLLYAVISFVILSAIISVVEGIFTLTKPGFVNTIIMVISAITRSIVEDGLVAFGVVTLIFIVIEKSNANKKQDNDWNIDDLKEVPSHKALEINRLNIIIGTIFSLIFTVLFIFIISNHNKYLGWFEPATYKHGLEMKVQLFNNNIKYAIIGIVVCFGLELFNNIYLLIKGSQDKFSIIIKTIYNISSILLMMIVLTTKSFINVQFFEKIATVSNTPIDKIMKMYNYTRTSFIIICIFIIGIIIFMGIKKYLRINNLKK